MDSEILYKKMCEGIYASLFQDIAQINFYQQEIDQMEKMVPDFEAQIASLEQQRFELLALLAQAG